MISLTEMAREMVISRDNYETRVGIVEDSELVEMYIERSTKSVVGNIYLGKVTDVLPGMQAAFVDIGLEKNAFLYVDDVRDHTGKGLSGRSISSMLSVGKKILVQVAKDPMGTKGARVTMEISIPGRFVVLMPFAHHVGVSKKIEDKRAEELSKFTREHLEDGRGAIVRTAAIDAGEKELLADISFLNRVWRRVLRQVADGIVPEVVYTEIDLAMRMVRDVFNRDFSKLVIDDKDTFEKVVSFLKRSAPELAKKVVWHKEKTISLFDSYDFSVQLKKALAREVDLPSGGQIVIDVTEALVAIDVNTGSFTGRKTLEDTILRTNLEAASEALKQIRLRDLGGIIVIDFIDMEEDIHKRKLEEHIAQLLERDRSKTQLSQITSLGLVQIARKRTTEGLYKVLTDVCPRCSGRGRSLSFETCQIEVERKIREIMASSRHQAFLFAINDETYTSIMDSGVNFALTIRAETGKHIRLVGERNLEPTEVNVLIEGTHPKDSFGKKRLMR